MADLGNQNSSRLPNHLTLSSTYSPSSYYHDAGGGGSVYFLLIRAAHYRSFTAWGVGSQSVICVHSTPALSIMVSGLSRHVSPPTHLSPPTPKCFWCLMSSQLPTQGESWSLLLQMSNKKRFQTRDRQTDRQTLLSHNLILELVYLFAY